MMNIYIKYSLIIQLFLLTPVVIAQPYSAFTDVAFKEAEEVVLFTDRNIYAVNETVFFRSFYKKEGNIPADSWSRVLYVELVSPQGQTISRGKFQHDKNGAAGYFQIPSDILTGNYFLKAYTKWMRNYGAASFAYVPLKIINPFNKEILKEENEIPAAGPAAVMRNPEFSPVILNTGKFSYTKEEKVDLQVEMKVSPEGTAGDFCISVIPYGLADTTFQPAGGVAGKKDDFRFEYLPEIRGISISGKVLSTTGKAPLSSAPVHFAVLEENSDYFVALTDKEGRFAINVPEWQGQSELFVACEPVDSENGEILIDQDFSPGNAPPEIAAFELSEEEKEASRKMIINMQLKNAYEKNSLPGNDSPEKINSSPFYCNSDIHVDTRDFVQLPTMTEVFDNLVSGVNIRKRNGEPYFAIESENRSIGQFKPLVLVDHIPVFNLQDVLDIHPSKVKTIDVVKEVYLLGNTRFGGIIHIATRKGDMGAVDLPKGSFFLDFTGFFQGSMKEMNSTENLYAQGKTKKQEQHLPDTRNTIYWVNSYNPNEEGLQFEAPGKPGKYIVLLRGVDPEGGYIFGKTSFEVR